MFFLYSRSAKAPLTKDRMLRILKAHRCTLRYRFEGVFAADCTDQEYYACRTADLASMTVQHFTAALSRAFSFRVWES